MPLPFDRQQRIGRLTPWREAVAAIAQLAMPVAPQKVGAGESAGCIAAADVSVAAAIPAVPTAVRDGWAVRADLVADAGPYAPAPLAPPPPWIESGEPLPATCDAVLPPDAVAEGGSGSEALAPAAPGEGVAPTGFDAVPGTVLVRAGVRVGASARAALAAAGIAAVEVRRPRVGVVRLGAPPPEGDPVASLVAAALSQSGAAPVLAAPTQELARLIASERLDALVTLGGTGEGHEDRTALIVAAAGRPVLHGVGMRPGETAGLGVVADRPVLLLPGRLDAALGAWLLIGLPLLRRLTGAADAEAAPLSPLTRKLTSNIGLAEAVLVERDGGGVRPIAAGAFPLSALACADGWVLVPPESEGYASGTQVAVKPLP